MTVRVSATRLELLRARRRLDRVQRGLSLLRKKREALVTEFFRLARPAADMRERIRGAAAAAHRVLAEALAVHGQAGLLPASWPRRPIEVEVELASVWGVPVARSVTAPPLSRSLAARATSPGVTGPAAVEAAGAYERLVEQLLEAAPRELLLRGLADALARTTRQIRTLEHRVIPALSSRIAALARTLDEREREDQVRLRFLASPASR